MTWYATLHDLAADLVEARAKIMGASEPMVRNVIS